MPKLYFRYGTMNSSKTANLLMTAHNYVSQNKKIFLIKPKVDTRFNVDNICSRAIKGVKADCLMTPEMTSIPNIHKDVKCILVDEAQFLSPVNVDYLRVLTDRFPHLLWSPYGL